MKLKTRIIAFILMLLTVFYAIPVSVFAEAAFSEKSGKKSESSSTEVQASEKDSNGELATITTDSTTYTFTYDSFGNSSSVQVGDSNLATYEYNEYNGKLIKVTYGNGYYKRYVYNELGQLSEVWCKNGSEAEKCLVKYTYNSDGSIAAEEDVTNGTVKVYVYDTKGRLSEVGEYDSADNFYHLDEKYIYNTEGRVSAGYYTLNYTSSSSVISDSEVTNSYSYNSNGSISSSYVNLGKRLDSTYDYDSYQRIHKIVYSVSGGFSNEVTYGYRNSGNYLSANEIASYTSKVGSTTSSYTYTYDQRGNITGITVGGSSITYAYDDLGQLVRENNQLLGKTYVYTYDNAGNILTKKTYSYTTATSLGTPTSTDTYGYSTGTWGDQLTSYNGNAFKYDAIGNPEEYYNGTAYYFTWQGRQLASATKGGVTSTFKYNADGLRTEKDVGGVKHTYYYAGTQLLAEQWGTHLMVFLYDATGLPLGIAYRTSDQSAGTWTNYWFERNFQGDVVAIYDNSNTKLVSYNYDAWGNHTTTYYNGGGNITAIVNNPIRYRGYYYDVDLDLYYVTSRYYDCKIARWINADTTDVLSLPYYHLGQYNLFSYCNNNPVNDRDDDGQLSWLAKIAIGAAAIAVGVGVTALTGGAALPALVAGVKAACVAGAISAGTSAAKTAVRSAASGDSFSTVVQKSAKAAVDSFADGFMAGGITAGASQVVSGVFKIAAKLGAKTGKSGGIKLGNTKILSPDAVWQKNNGGTLLKIGKTFRIDVGSNTLLHVHIPKISSHIQIGTIVAGIYGGLK